MAQLAHQQVAITGTGATFDPASSGGDTVAPDDRAWLRAKNGSGAALRVAVTVPGSKFGQPLTDVEVSIPAGGEDDLGPLVGELADPSTGLVDITYPDGVTSLTVAALRI